MTVEIRSQIELEEFLEGKSSVWGNVIATRAAFRVLPYSFAHESIPDSEMEARLVASLFRALAHLSASVRKEPDQTVRQAAAYAANYTKGSLYGARGKVDRGYEDAVRSVANATNSAGFGGSFAALSAIQYAASAYHLVAAAELEFWRALSSDCGLLMDGVQPEELVARSLWPENLNWFNKGEWWSRAARWLSRPEDGFAIWREWYYGRLEGLPHAFADFDDGADEKFYRWIIEQNDDWWRREPREVNAEIKEFVDGLRKRSEAADPQLPTQAELNQNQRAITFTAEDNGKVGLAAIRDVESVDQSDAAQQRHAEVLAEARNALETCRPNVTQATDIEGPMERYIAALGDSTYGISPALLITRGEKLRRLIDARHDDSNSAIPFSEAQAGALKDWLVAHNLLVGLDPYLSDIERTARGPDAVPTVLDLEALKAVIESSKTASIPNAEASQALDDLVENVPINAAQTDRRLIQATEGLKNFVRGIGAVIKKHRWKFAAGGFAVERAYAAAEWVQRNTQWLREVFANEPSILSILEKIAALPL